MEKASATQTAAKKSGPASLGLTPAPQFTANPMLRLQQSIGNQAMLRLFHDGRLQAKLRVNPLRDPYELEAERVADAIGSGAKASPLLSANLGVQHRESLSAIPSSTSESKSPIEQALNSAGRPLETGVRRQMQDRFGQDFSHVRVHTDEEAALSAKSLNASAYTLGSHVVFDKEQYNPSSTVGLKLLAHELAHVVQQSRTSPSPTRVLQRKVILTGTEMPAPQRAAFLKARKWPNAALAKSIMDDMAAAGDIFDFVDEHELEIEIRKRESTVLHMEEAQKDVPGGLGRAFAYPFGESYQTELYGPRVNYAASEYWEPPVPDAYRARTDPAYNKSLLDPKRPRSKRCEVYGDQCGLYGWQLSAKGRKDPYQAVALLFKPQREPRLRSLIHCDYLISLVNMMSLADAVGQAEFNKRVQAFGAEKFFLNARAFTNLNPIAWEMIRTGQLVQAPSGAFLTKRGLGSTQAVRPSSAADLVIGDHVIFENHLAYDLLNQGVGNSWRLENAVLIRRNPSDPKKDVFLGHGSGELTAEAMQQKLADKFQEVWRMADHLVREATSGPKKQQAAAWNLLNVRFPNVKWYPPARDWTVLGYPPLMTDSRCSRFVVWILYDLRKVRGKDVVGLKDPCDLTKLRTVERPIESAK